ncbi:MAG TPA: PASTA domain-containing protein, partial [Acidimicrobiia bacterium]|nr:PASTA domain-containing protein [Acidimicrobiia bacterium]
IKPANLLFDEHGRVRVADFGLARALAEASWTEPVGAVFGTARYASPEQANGVQLDARSDLYSLALVLVEAVTGTVPFAADTTLGTLTARTQRSLTAPEEVGALGPVIDRAGALTPANRYPDAATMRQALTDVGESLPPPAPLTLAGMTDHADPHPTRAVPARGAPLFDQDAIEIVPGDEPQAKRGFEPQRRLVPIFVAIAFLAAAALGAVALARVRSGPSIAVPNFIGMTLDRARSTARSAGLDVREGAHRYAPDPVGSVIDQRPVPGNFTTSHHVTLVLSDGPAPIAVPSVIGQQWLAVGKPAFDAAGLRSRETYVFNETVAKGVVIALDPAPPRTVAPDTLIKVTISKGHAPVAVPNVAKLTYAKAVKKLQAAHFTVQRGADVFDDTVPKGAVVSTEPASGPTLAPYGSTVVVHVSKGPDLVTVPDVRGESIDAASADLDAAGLQLRNVQNYRPGSLVLTQSITPGERVKRGTPIDLTFSKHGEEMRAYDARHGST